MKPLRKSGMTKFTMRGLAVLSTAFLLSLLVILCRSAGAQDAQRVTARAVQPPPSEQAAKTASAPFPVLPQPDAQVVAPPASSPLPTLSSPELGATTHSAAEALALPPEKATAPVAQADQALVPAMPALETKGCPPTPVSSSLPSASPALEVSHSTVRATTDAPSIEEMVQKLRELDRQKNQHLKTAEELDRQRRSILVLLQKRLADQKHIVDEMAAGARAPVSVAPLGSAAQGPSVQAKLDTLLLRLERLEKRIDAVEKPQIPSSVIPSPGTQSCLPSTGPAPGALDVGFPMNKGPKNSDQAFSFWVGFYR